MKPHKGNGWAGWEPRECTYCGCKLTLNSAGAMHKFDHVSKVATSICQACLFERRRAA